MMLKALNSSFLDWEDTLKVGSHDPIFSSNYSSAHFLRQQLDVWTPIFDKFSTFFMYWISIRLDQKNRQFLIFLRSILQNIWT